MGDILWKEGEKQLITSLIEQLEVVEHELLSTILVHELAKNGFKRTATEVEWMLCMWMINFQNVI